MSELTDQEIKDFKWYANGVPWLRERTISLHRSGSHAYGTNLPGSDIDLRGVAVAPKRYYLGFVDKFEQAQTHEPVDATVFDIKKFFALAAAANPNILEQLFVADEDVFIAHTAWYCVLANRTAFLSKKCVHTFTGYAAAQMKRIKTHRQWLLNPPKEKPERRGFGLPDGEPTLGKERLGVIESKIRKLSDGLGGAGLNKGDLDDERIHFEIVADAAAELGINNSLIPVIMAERRFAAACKNWAAYQTWKKERNPARAALEAKFGYDTKHGMHLVRLLRMGTEILEHKGVVVRRPDAEELLAIRAGAWDFDRISAYAAEKEAEIQELAKTSTLQRAPDLKRLDDLLIYCVEIFNDVKP